MQLPPPAILASWPVGNYENPSETHGAGMLIMTSVFLPISLIVVFLRIYTRLRISHSFGADDVCIILATIATIVCAGLSLNAAQHLGWNRHVWDVPPAQIITGLKYIIPLEISFGMGCAFTKMSLLLFIRRLMSPWSGILRTLTWLLIVISATELVVYAIVVIFTCR
jgi:hypothetical protein